MQLGVKVGDPLWESTDALIIPIPSGSEGPIWSNLIERVDEALVGHLRSLAEESRFRARAGRTLTVPTLGHTSAKRVILAGLGPEITDDEHAFSIAGGAGARAARDAGTNHVVVALLDSDRAAPDTQIEALATGVLLGLYRFDAYRGKGASEPGEDRNVDSATFVGANLMTADAEAALSRAESVARAVGLARDLSNEPGSDLTPRALADRALEVAGTTGLSVEVLGPEELTGIGAAATLAVGGGSANPPCLIRLRYRPGAADGERRIIGLVGKAITFDTGGYSIKTHEGMLNMKGDMAGGGAVLGAMSALRELNCPVAVEATICAAENSISGTAFRPGDVIRGMNGVTMEIVSTDAEGRLVLADGLVDTARRGATELIDLATLTGAAVVALGDGTSALFASEDDLADELIRASRRAGERLWRLPLIDDLERKIEGDVADIKNSGGRSGGAITAALFLRHFIEGRPWAHLDIAGSARQDKATPLGPKGATGVGVRTLLNYLTSTQVTDGSQSS
jgi:leucyl aminopeptidase